MRRLLSLLAPLALVASTGCVVTPYHGHLRTYRTVEVAQYRFMTVPKGTPQDVRDRLTEGMKATCTTVGYKAFNQQKSLTPVE